MIDIGIGTNLTFGDIFKPSSDISKTGAYIFDFENYQIDLESVVPGTPGPASYQC